MASARRYSRESRFSARKAVKSAGIETIPDLSRSHIGQRSDDSHEMNIPYFTTLVGLLYHVSVSGGSVPNCYPYLRKDGACGTSPQYRLTATTRARCW